jgi:pimeloyl-ACP methyl ester carboxylesterase
MMESPAFEPADCMFDPLIPGMRDETIRCGYLTVPEQRRGEDDDGRTIRLAVAILESTGHNPSPDPLFIAQGGPGGSTIDTYANLLVDHPLRQERDLVLFDQRGTLYSEPNLLCPESFDATSELLAADIEESRMIEPPDRGCVPPAVDRRRTSTWQPTTAWKMPPTSRICASPWATTRSTSTASPMARCSVFISCATFPTTFAASFWMAWLRLRPTSSPGSRRARSASSANSSTPAGTMSNVLNSIPDLEDRFFALVEQLNENPATITLTDPETGERTQATLWGDDVIDFLFQMFYVSGSVGALPAAIADVERGDYSYLETMFSVFLFDRSMSEGMYNSVICAEEADFTSTDALVDGVRPEFAESIAEELEDMIDGCAQWDVPVLPGEVNNPVESDIPTLLLSGLFDPITPPQFAEMAQETLPNSYNFVLPTGGHGVAFAVDDCIDRIVDDFLDDPLTEPSSGCLNRVEPIEFAADNAKTVPILGFLNSLSSNAWRHVGMAALLLAGVLSAFVVWPLGWFLRAVRGIQVERSENEIQWRWGGRSLILLFGAMALMFVFGFVLVTVGVVLFDTNLLILSAMPRTVMPLFLLPFGLALTTIGLLIVTVQQWRKSYGSLWDRLYYSFLLVCALATSTFSIWMVCLASSCDRYDTGFRIRFATERGILSRRSASDIGRRLSWLSLCSRAYRRRFRGARI